MKKIIIFVTIATVFSSPVIASAMTQEQVNAILAVLSAFNVEPSILVSVQATLQATVPTTTPSTPPVTSDVPSVITPQVIIIPVYQQPKTQPAPVPNTSTNPTVEKPYVPEIPVVAAVVYPELNLSCSSTFRQNIFTVELTAKATGGDGNYVYYWPQFPDTLPYEYTSYGPQLTPNGTPVPKCKSEGTGYSDVCFVPTSTVKVHVASSYNSDYDKVYNGTEWVLKDPVGFLQRSGGVNYGVVAKSNGKIKSVSCDFPVAPFGPGWTTI